MNIKKICTFLPFIFSFYTPFSFAQNHNQLDKKLKIDIRESYESLQRLASYCGSRVNRQYYLKSLNNVIDDFHQIDEQSISTSPKKYDKLALVFMGNINSQHKAGLSLDGNMNNNLFTDINSDTLSHQRVIADNNNRGSENISVSIENADKLSGEQYRLTFDSPFHYTLRREKDKAIIASASIEKIPQFIYVIVGITIKINSGEIIRNDSFVIAPLRHAARNIQLLINDPDKIALGWPVHAHQNYTSPGSNADIRVNSITDPDNASFATPGELNPPLKIKFLSDKNGLSYSIFDNSTSSERLIGGSYPYDPDNTELFPTKDGYDPGYRVRMNGTAHTGDVFNIDYNKYPAGDNQNALAILDLYNSHLSDYINQ